MYNKHYVTTLIPEEGHAKVIDDILSKIDKPEYYPTVPSIILIGNYKAKNAKPYKIDISTNCNAIILYFKGTLRGATFHPCMDNLSDDEIKLCAKAGYEAEGKDVENYKKSSDYRVYSDPATFKPTQERFNSFLDAYAYYSTFLNHIT